MAKKVDLSVKSERDKFWNDKAVKTLRGRTIVAVRYIGDEEANDNMWSKRGLVLKLDNGLTIIPGMDDEFNDTGVLHYVNAEGQWDCLPSL
jgi:hypothetical protein